MPWRILARRRTRIIAKIPMAAASGASARARVYTVPMTTSETRSSTTATDSKNTRTRSGNRGPVKASIPRAKAESVDIAAPQPSAAGRPAFRAR